MRILLLILFIGFSLITSAQELFTPEWTKYFYDESNDLINPAGLVVDSDENVYIAFTGNNDIFIDTLTIETNGEYDLGVIAKFNKEGELLWTSEYSDPYSDFGSVYFFDIKIDHDNEIIISGYVRGNLINRGYYYIDSPTPNYTGFIQKINAQGDNIFFKSFDSIVVLDLAIGPNNEISGIANNFGYTGNFLGEDVDSSVLHFSCNADLELNFLLHQQVPSEKYDDIFLYPIVLPQVTANNQNETFVAYNYADTMELNGNLYLPHNYFETVVDSYWIDYDSFEVYTYIIEHVASDGVIVKYDTSGAELWHCKIEGKEFQLFYNLSIDEIGNIYAIGMFYQGDTIFIKDSTFIIYPDEFLDVQKPYIILKIDPEGTPIAYTFSEDSIFLFSELVLSGDQLFVPGQIYSDESNWRGAALGRYDLDFNLMQFGQATCAYVSPCRSISNIEFLAVHDSSIYVLGDIVTGTRWGTDTILVPHWGNEYFISKLPYDFSDPYILPEELTTDYNENAIYPVPVNNVINISFTDYDAEIENCLITNSLGQQWQFTTKKNNLNNWEVDVHHLRRGVYFISYSINDKTYSHTFIKM